MEDKENLLTADDGSKKHKIDPGIHTEGKGSNGNRKKFTYSAWSFLVALLLVFLINYLLFTPHIQYASVDYSTFKSLVSDGTIVQVAFDGDQYIGYSVTKDDARGLLSEIARSRQIPLTLSGGIKSRILLQYSIYGIF